MKYLIFLLLLLPLHVGALATFPQGNELITIPQGAYPVQNIQGTIEPAPEALQAQEEIKEETPTPIEEDKKGPSVFMWVTIVCLAGFILISILRSVLWRKATTQTMN